MVWLLCAACLRRTALGQQAGQIVGVVTDSSGGVVPGITITAKEVATGFTPVNRYWRRWSVMCFPTLRPPIMKSRLSPRGFGPSVVSASSFWQIRI